MVRSWDPQPQQNQMRTHASWARGPHLDQHSIPDRSTMDHPRDHYATTHYSAAPQLPAPSLYAAAPVSVPPPPQNSISSVGVLAHQSQQATQQQQQQQQQQQHSSQSPGVAPVVGMSSHNSSAMIQPHHKRPMQIDKALKEYCQIPLKDCFVGALLEDGSVAMFSGPTNLDQATIRCFFDSQKFATTMNRINNDGSFYGTEGSPEILSDYRGRRYDSSDRHSVTKKRRFTDEYDYSDDDDPPVPRSIVRRPLTIGNSEAVWNFYQQRLRSCQQNACKIIAKAWVKAVEPKKQSHHPYTGRDERAPDWWPKATSKEDKVRHKEPDHLYKKERVNLLTHIIRLVTKPINKQHPEVAKSNLSIKKIEEITWDALSAFFNDKENPSNIKKKPFLMEIFAVAKQEERYLRNEIDGETTIMVMIDEKTIENAGHPDPSSGVRKDDDPNSSPHPSAGRPRLVRDIYGTHGNSMPPQPLSHSHPQGMLPPVSASTGLNVPPSGSYGLNDLPQPYVNTGMSIHQPSVLLPDLSSSTATHPSHDPQRRPSLVNADFPSPLYPSSASGTAHAWQQSPGPTTPGTGSMYTFSASGSTTHGNGFSVGNMTTYGGPFESGAQTAGVFAGHRYANGYSIPKSEMGGTR